MDRKYDFEFEVINMSKGFSKIFQLCVLVCHKCDENDTSKSDIAFHLEITQQDWNKTCIKMTLKT